ncbi:MAG: methionyl-tRNA formyltransferase [Oscillospiraceae bacterium]|nr:methionyl-tRNA formyltransferase [Oscillospiraceae bacterium]
MALVTKENLTKADKERNMVHNKVRATYTTFTSDGEKYFQIDTYGSPNRELKDKISQSIQIDKEMAKELMKILIDTFEIL